MNALPEVPAAPALAGTRRQFVAGLALAGAGLPLAVRATDPLVVAQVAPFSGPQAITGRAVHAGAKLHFEAVNARGGIKGRPIKFVTRALRNNLWNR
ncbi:ABC transporter substrate-binding protein [Xenophilus sp. Marseille-Q4582]|uniref:ABC transporter substrate-binding protein n=1 Tax=Xenophilus sp. Marseille-Q4582 TaxID=2866600 RepID=UPI001CE3BF5F|nr:ABC transporter substrate-binding protein [Xenophilus sp. Marseille-Q4582]